MTTYAVSHGLLASLSPTDQTEQQLWGCPVLSKATVNVSAVYTGILSNMVANGTFDADANWTKGAGWTIGSGVATKSAGTESDLSQAITFFYGWEYQIIYTITRTAGTITPKINGTSGTTQNAAGTYTDKIVAGASGGLAFTADSSFAGTVDVVSITPIIAAPRIGIAILGAAGTATTENWRHGPAAPLNTDGIADQLTGIPLAAGQVINVTSSIPGVAFHVEGIVEGA